MLAALAVGAAINDKQIVSIDLPVSFYLPEVDGARGAVTLRQLLSRQSAAPDAAADAGQLARVLEKVSRQGLRRRDSRDAVEAAGGGDVLAGARRARPTDVKPCARTAACAHASATGCASASCWPTTAYSRRTSSRRRGS